MRVPSRQQIRSGLKVFGFWVLPFWFIFGQDMFHKQEELRQRKNALDISTAFVNYHSGVGKKRLTKKEHRTLRDMEALLKKRHTELSSKVNGGQPARSRLSKFFLERRQDLLRNLREFRENIQLSGEGP